MAIKHFFARLSASCLALFLVGALQAQEEETTDAGGLEFRFQEAMQLIQSNDEDDAKKAAAALKKLAVEGHARSQYWLAQLYFVGTGVSESEKQGKLWIERSAQGGYPIAMLALAELLLAETDAENNYPDCIKLLETLLGPETSSSVPPEEFGLYRTAKSRASYLAGLFYLNGWGVEVDKPRAIELLLQASRTGSKDASMILAISYAKGEEVDRDAARSKEFFELYDLQTVDEANRNIEASFGGTGDSGDRQILSETSEAVSAAISDMVSATQTEFAREVLDETSEEYDPAFAATLLRFAADKRFSEAEMMLGLLYYRGLGVAQDIAKAAELFESSASKGWILAKYNYAAMIRSGQAAPPEGVSEENLLEEAAQRGLFVAQVALDDAVEIEPLNSQEALDACLAGVEEKDARALFSLAIRKSVGWHVEQETDFKKVIALYQESADRGFKRAQYVVGMMEIAGQERQRDPATGLALVRSAAYQGLPEAIYELGRFYLVGMVVERDIYQAFQEFKRAAELGYKNANNRIAAFYYHGIIVPKNEYIAAELYLAAADEGDAEAAFNLGNCYLQGKGVVMDAKAGIRWISKSAELGNLVACFQLADLYEENLMVDRDLVEVAYWRERAAEFGNKASMRETAFNYFLAWGHPKNRGKALMWIENYLAHPGPVDPNKLYYPGEYEDYAFVQETLPDDLGALLLLADLKMEEGWSGTDKKQGIEIYEQLASAGSKGAKIRLAAQRFADGASSKEAKQSASDLKALYEDNRYVDFDGKKRYAREVAYLLSKFAEAGFGMKKSTAGKSDWLLAAAELEHRDAQFDLGLLLTQTGADAVSQQQGSTWLLKAARGGDIRSQLWVARAYLRSPMANLEEKTVINWLKILVDSGSAEARVILREYGVRYKLPEPSAEPESEPGEEKPEAEPNPWAPVGVA